MLQKLFLSTKTFVTNFFLTKTQKVKVFLNFKLFKSNDFLFKVYLKLNSGKKWDKKV